MRYMFTYIYINLGSMFIVQEFNILCTFNKEVTTTDWIMLLWDPEIFSEALPPVPQALKL